MKRALVVFAMIISIFASSLFTIKGNTAVEKVLIPMGGGYENLAADFVKQILPKASNRSLKVLVLPVAYASDPFSIDEAERKSDIASAEVRVNELQQACAAIVPQDTQCEVVLVPVFIRKEAETFDPNVYFVDKNDLSGVFLLGGDQDIAWQVVKGTALEKALSQWYEQGIPIGGTSAGAALLSKTMLSGYNSGFGEWNALDFGAIALGINDKRGLEFGLPGAIIDQHMFQHGRVARLLNAISLTGAPQFGIGIDAFTGIQISDDTRLHDVFGRYAILILDGQTYHAADSVQYYGERNILNLRNIVVQLLVPGGFSYDLVNHQHSSASLPDRIERNFEFLKTPKGAGLLILSGSMKSDLRGSAILNRFINLAGGKKARFAMVLSGFATSERMAEVEKAYRLVLPSDVTVVTTTQDGAGEIEIPSDVTGIILVGEDASEIPVAALKPVRDAWAGGVPLLAVNAGSSVAGSFFVAQPPNPSDLLENEQGTEEPLLIGKANIQPGLGLIKAGFEPELMENNRWARWFALGYNHPNEIVFGFGGEAGIEITQKGALAIGENPVLSLDLRQAHLDKGSNQALAIANGLLDVFAPSDPIGPSPADINSAPVRMATPFLPTDTPTPLPIALPSSTLTLLLPTNQAPEITASAIVTTEAESVKVTPTRTPRLTPTPFVIIEPTDPRLLRSIVGLGTIALVIVLLGSWLIRRRS